MIINWQPILKGDLVELIPLQEFDFERLYKVAADPLIWEQHPEPGRYQRESFQKFFESGLQSKGALLVLDNLNNEVIGSSRYYHFDRGKAQIFIGYTFLARKCWGGVYNKEIKKLMIGYALDRVENVLFEIGINNFRSRKAIEKIGAILEKEDNNVATYRITREVWQKKQLV